MTTNSDDTNVANNVVQPKVQDLTEQWKKGELPRGYYYAEDNGEELIIHIQEKNGSVMGDDFNLEATDWIKPIAPVPSYDHFVELTEKVKENQQLKELLKECRDMINNHCSWQVMDRPNHYVKKIENDIYEPLLTKIDNAIGEKK